MIAAIVLLGCSGGDAPPVEPTPDPAPAPVPAASRDWVLEFNHLKVEDPMLMATQATATSWAMVDGKRVDLELMHIYAHGDDGFGDLYDASGAKMDTACNNQDFDALFEAHGHPWLVSHFECTPGAVYLTRLKQDAAGRLSPEMNRRVDFSAVGGAWNPCAGVISPWGTHIGSEEYEPNARSIPTDDSTDGWDAHAWKSHQRYLREGEALNPYLYGWTPEITVLDAEGRSSVVKHKAPGRFSHEVAYVLPDERTVYLSDDGGAEGFYMFVADRPRDLSSGYLYAARWRQRADLPVRADIDWIHLGHADDAYVDGLIAAGVTFDDLFDVAEPDGFYCPDGYRFTHTDYVKECLRLKEPSAKVADPAKAASRLETRRYAATLAATTEFEKGEGITYDPKSNQLYLSLSKIGRRMLEEPGAPDDHIQLAKNDCGMVLVGKTGSGVLDNTKNLIGSMNVLTRFDQLVAGSPLDKPDARGNTCFETGIANPDNITYLPGYDVLMIGEDTSNHAVASLWALETRKNTLKRVLVAPPHGEVTGIYWSPDIGGHGYLTVAIQHPWRAEGLEETVVPEGITEADRRSITAVLGPFPALD